MQRPFTVLLILILALVAVPVAGHAANELRLFDTKGVLRYSGELDSERYLQVQLVNLKGFPLEDTEVVLRNKVTGARFTATSSNGTVTFSNILPGDWEILGKDKLITVKHVSVTSSLAVAGSTAGASGGSALVAGAGTTGAVGATGGAVAGSTAGVTTVGAATGGSILGVSATTAAIGATAAAGVTVAAVDASNSSSSPVSPFQ